MNNDNTSSTNAVASATISLRGFADGDLITKRELGKCLGCSGRTIQRMVERFELPPPMGLAGRKVWLAGKIRAWLTAAAERREAEALQEARRLKIFTF
jgi:predicted DNA-binding transcriptional regulator AlpA